LLRHFRERAGLTQEALAEKANLSPNAIGALERGERRRPYPSTLRMLADALELSAVEREQLTEIAAGRESQAQASHGAVREMPAPLTALIGRTTEGQVLDQLLRRKDLRLLTLTGPGGVGKTRLAIEAANHCRDAFTDGMAFVSLAPIRDPNRVLPTIAQTLGMDEIGGTTSIQSLMLWLRDRRFLLVLDNFEQVSAAAPQVVELLQACSHLKILATSREPLRVRGEQVYLVPPLAFPQTPAPLSVEEATEYDAVQLFIERTRSVRLDFALTLENVGTVGQICARLDGIPLAIELAAARSVLFSPDVLLSMLNSQMQVLTGGARDLPDRQQTMRAAIAWSYDLLNPGDQILFRRLAVFSGGGTLEGLMNLFEPGGVLPEDLLDGVESLAVKNLVQLESGAVILRVHMLETIRAYGLEQLHLHGELEAAQEAHAQYFLDLAQKANPHLTGEEQLTWVDQLSRERSNLRAAVQYWLDRRDWATAIRLTWALWRFWWVKGMHREAREWMEAVLARADLSQLSSLNRAQAEIIIGSMAWAAGEYATAADYCQAGVNRYTAHGDAAVQLIGLLMSGASHLSCGDYLLAASAFSGMLAADFEVVREPWCEAFALTYLGLVNLLQGSFQSGQDLLEQGLALARLSGDRIVIHQALYNLGVSHAFLEDDARALPAFAEGLALVKQTEDNTNAGYLVRAIAEIALRRAASRQAVRLLSAAHALLELAGAPVLRYGFERARHIETHSRAQSVLGDEMFSHAWAEGKSLEIEQVHEEAHIFTRAAR
jgi:predicted ATPase/DNA-binding XRE family transcriptional regulator